MLIAAASVAFLLTLLLLNRKLEENQALPYVRVLRAVYLAILLAIYGRTLYGVLTADSLPLPPPVVADLSAKIFLFISAMVVLYFFVTDYAQYRKRRDNPEAAGKALRRALGVLLFSALLSLFGLFALFTVS